MSIRAIIIDSLTYPFSNWMRFLLLGIIVLISFSPVTVSFIVKLNFLPFISLTIIGFLVGGSLISGYLFEIISNSLNEVNELPQYKNWKKMFINGIKVLVINFIYLIPIILFTISLFRYPLIEENFTNLANLSHLNLGLITSDVIYALIHITIAALYLVIITPVILMAVANMAYNNGKFSAAFKFSEIFTNIINLPWDEFSRSTGYFYGDVIPVIIGFFLMDEIIEIISSIGWKKLIVWYISTGMTVIILGICGVYIVNIFSSLILNSLNIYSIENYQICIITITSLILIPYLLIFISRSTALIYNSAIKIYLKRDKYP